MEEGARLTRARQQLGLSRDVIAATTGLSVSAVAALEQDQSDDYFPSLAEARYARTAYMRALGRHGAGSPPSPASLDAHETPRHHLDDGPDLSTFALENPSANPLDDFAAEPDDVPFPADHPADIGGVDDSVEPKSNARGDGAVLVPRADVRPAIRLIRVTPALGISTLLFALLLGSILTTWTFVTRPRTNQSSPRHSPSRPAEMTLPSSAAGRSVAGTRAAAGPVAPDSGKDAGSQSVFPAAALNGWWELATRVEASTYQPYKGLRLGYVVRLSQDGAQISGDGQKRLENGRRLPPARRTPITLNGAIQGRRVTLTFVEYGARRTSGGTFNLELTKDGLLLGQFESTAAQSRGRLVARRVS